MFNPKPIIAAVVSVLALAAIAGVTSGPAGGGTSGGGNATNAVSTLQFNGGVIVSNGVLYNLNNANAVTSGVSVVQAGQTVTYTMHNNTNAPGLTNINVFSGRSNSFSGNIAVASNAVVSGALNANSAVITNGITNSTLTAGALVWSDLNKALASVTIGTGLSFDSGSGTLRASAGSGTGAGDGITIATNSNSQLAVTNIGINLTDAVTISVDVTGYGPNVDLRVTLGGNRTIANPTGLFDTQLLRYRIKQDATGNRTGAWGNKYKFGTTIPDTTLSTNAAYVDHVWFQYNQADDSLECVHFDRGTH